MSEYIMQCTTDMDGIDCYVHTGVLIRCKDCKYAEVADSEDNQDGYTCRFHRGSIWFSGSYCSWAESKA